MYWKVDLGAKSYFPLSLSCESQLPTPGLFLSVFVALRHVACFGSKFALNKQLNRSPKYSGCPLAYSLAGCLLLSLCLNLYRIIFHLCILLCMSSLALHTHKAYMNIFMLPFISFCFILFSVFFFVEHTHMGTAISIFRLACVGGRWVGCVFVDKFA